MLQSSVTMEKTVIKIEMKLKDSATISDHKIKRMSVYLITVNIITFLKNYICGASIVPFGLIQTQRTKTSHVKFFRRKRLITDQILSSCRSSVAPSTNQHKQLNYGQ